MTRRERWYHSAHVAFALVSLIVALAMIFVLREAVGIRADLLALEQQTAQTAAGVLASCERGNAIRRALGALLEESTNPRTRDLLTDARLQVIPCIPINPGGGGGTP